MKLSISPYLVAFYQLHLRLETQKGICMDSCLIGTHITSSYTYIYNSHYNNERQEHKNLP